jgi:hypothetical protein
LKLVFQAQLVEGEHMVKPRILEWVYVWSPKVKASPSSIVESTSLSANDGSNRSDKLIIKSSAHQDGLWERSRMAEITGAAEVDSGTRSYTVEAFLPMTIVRV